jgi:hypothetical protein
MIGMRFSTRKGVAAEQGIGAGEKLNSSWFRGGREVVGCPDAG